MSKMSYRIQRAEHHMLGLLIAATLLPQSVIAASLQYNENELAMIAIEASVAPAVKERSIISITADGNVEMVPGYGGITVNFRTGDSAFNIAGDHVEPAISVFTLGASNDRMSYENRALNALACIGNKVLVLTGQAKGKWGYVIGKHGGVEHVMIDFPDDVFGKITVQDKFQIMSIGAGMQFRNIGDVRVSNTSPELLEAFVSSGTEISPEGLLRIGVTHFVPAKIMGSGLGENHTYTGDYDIQTFDKETVHEYGLDTLRFGDIVAIVNADNTYGRIYLEEAISIGVVVHGISKRAGHGPGVTTLFTSKDGNIEPFLDENANLKNLLNVR